MLFHFLPLSLEFVGGTDSDIVLAWTCWHYCCCCLCHAGAGVGAGEGAGGTLNGIVAVILQGQGQGKGKGKVKVQAALLMASSPLSCRGRCRWHC